MYQVLLTTNVLPSLLIVMTGEGQQRSASIGYGLIRTWALVRCLSPAVPFSLGVLGEPLVSVGKSSLWLVLLISQIPPRTAQLLLRGSLDLSSTTASIQVAGPARPPSTCSGFNARRQWIHEPSIVSRAPERTREGVRVVRTNPPATDTWSANIAAGANPEPRVRAVSTSGFLVEHWEIAGPGGLAA